MSPKLKVEEVLKEKVSNSEFSNAANYVENLGFQVNEKSPDALIRVMARFIKDVKQKGAFWQLQFIKLKIFIFCHQLYTVGGRNTRRIYMVHEDPRKIKVIDIGKLKGTKPQETQKSKEVKLLNGVDKVDYRKGGKWCH